MVWHFPHYRHKIHPYSIILEDGWKLIKYYSGDIKYQLFNLNEDLSEKNDLSKKKRIKVKKLEKTMMKLLKEMGAVIPVKI